MKPALHCAALVCSGSVVASQMYCQQRARCCSEATCATKSSWLKRLHADLILEPGQAGGCGPAPPQQRAPGPNHLQSNVCTQQRDINIAVAVSECLFNVMLSDEQH